MKINKSMLISGVILLIILSFVFFYIERNTGENENISLSIVDSLNLKYDDLYTLFYEKNDYKLAKYEPEEKVYSGVYLLDSEKENSEIQKFEDTYELSNNIYKKHIKVGDRYPLNWILECYSKNKVPFVSITYNEAYSFYNSQVVKSMAVDFGKLDIPIFIEIIPDFTKLDISKNDFLFLYKNFYNHFSIYAPNVAFVWTIDIFDVYEYMDYYPGDEYADWIGVNIVQDIVEDGKYKNFQMELEYLYYLFQEKKPIIISKFAVNNFYNYNYYINEARDEIFDFYSNVYSEYPRIKGIIYYNIEGYNLSSNDKLIKAYKSLINSNNFINERFYKNLKIYLDVRYDIEDIKSNYLAYKVGKDFYISKKAAEDIGFKIGENASEVLVNDEYCYKLNKNLKINNDKKVIKISGRNID